MKKLLFVVIFILITMDIAFAGDVPEAVLAGNADIFIIGRVMSVNNNVVVVKVEKVIMGELSEKTVDVKYFKYTAITDTRSQRGRS